MGNKPICCTGDEQNGQLLYSELKPYYSFRWHSRISEILKKDYNHIAGQNEYKAQPTLQTIKQQLHITGTVFNDLYNAFLENPKDLFLHSSFKISHVSSIIITDDSRSSQLAHSFIKATEIHTDLKAEINEFVSFFAGFIHQLYQTKQSLDEIKILLIDEIFENQSFYNYVKQQYDKGLSAKIRAYRQFVLKSKQVVKYKSAVEVLRTMSEKRSPREKLEILDQSLKQFNLNKLDADAVNDIVYQLVLEANIPSFVTEIKRDVQLRIYLAIQWGDTDIF